MSRITEGPCFASDQGPSLHETNLTPAPTNEHKKTPTPNLPIWSQTNCSCALLPLSLDASDKRDTGAWACTWHHAAASKPLRHQDSSPGPRLRAEYSSTASELLVPAEGTEKHQKSWLIMASNVGQALAGHFAKSRNIVQPLPSQADVWLASCHTVGATLNGLKTRSQDWGAADISRLSLHSAERPLQRSSIRDAQPQH